MQARDSSAILVKAVDFAARKHRTQRRKDSSATPYFNHLAEVAAILSELADVSDPELLAAAYLHDTVEDTDTSPQELELQFGPRVAMLVAAVTDDKRLPKQERKELQVQHAAHASPDVALLKMADKIANLRSLTECPPPSWDDARVAEYFAWARRVVDALPNRHPALMQEFERLQACRQTSTQGADGPEPRE